MRYSQISAFRALPCPALVFAQACQSLTAYGSCAHWARASSRPKLRSAGALRAVLEHGVSGVAQLPTGRSARLPPSLRVALGCVQGPTGATLPFGTVRCAHPPGKSPLLPILTAGLAMSRAMELDSFQQFLERARARLFPPSKWAGLFPFAAYRRSVPPQLAWGKLKWRCLGCFGVARMVLRHRKTDLNR